MGGGLLADRCQSGRIDTDSSDNDVAGVECGAYENRKSSSANLTCQPM